MVHKNLLLDWCSQVATMGVVRSGFWMVVIAVVSVLLSAFLTDHSLPFLYGGRVEPGFEGVEKAFRENFEKGYESDGAAFAVCHNGKMVVDLWGGYADKIALQPWKEDTISMAYSVTKGVSSLCIAMLVDRGQLEYGDLVTKYWPEFGAHGKANVTVKMLVGHEAGLAGLDEPITMEAVKDWRLMSRLFENQKPNWPPGTEAGYHTLTHGFLCDQLLRRVDPKQRSLGQYFKEEIAEPFGIDFYIGLPRDQLYRAARLTSATPWDWLIRLDDWGFVKFIFKLLTKGFSQAGKKALANPDWLQFRSRKYLPFNNPDVREMEIPAANGMGTARALARLYCLLGDKKSPLLSKATLDLISKPVLVSPEESVLRMNVSWGHGFMHWKKPNGKYTFGHPGFGGQSSKFDRDQNLAFGYLRNNISPEILIELVRTWRNLERATYESIRSLNTERPQS